jgi:hypothetical protein
MATDRRDNVSTPINDTSLFDHAFAWIGINTPDSPLLLHLLLFGLILAYVSTVINNKHKVIDSLIRSETLSASPVDTSAATSLCER